MEIRQVLEGMLIPSEHAQGDTMDAPSVSSKAAAAAAVS